MASARLIRRASSHNRRFSEDLERTETEPLLSEAGAELPDDDDDRFSVDPHKHHHFYPNPFADLPVYDTIWKIRRDILDAVNDPYTYDQLRAPRLTTAVVRPLLDKYYALQDLSIVFCLLVNRVQFLRDGGGYATHVSSLRATRATLCEMLALRLLRQFDEDSSGSDGLLLLTNIVIAGFDPFQNAPSDLCQNSARLAWVVQDRGGYERQLSALEVAILSESKLFLSSGVCKKVVEAIYMGRIVYTPTSFMDILPDHYKHKPISIYNPRKAPLLNTYRLMVPRIRNMIEVAHFVILLALYLTLMINKHPTRIGVEEIVFMVFTWGWILDQLASMVEHGWSVYSQNLWSFLDVSFATIFGIYFIMRMDGVFTHRDEIARPALDWLAMGAPFLVPRLAFNVFSENLVFVSLREMMSKFLLLTFLAVWSFAGFFLAMVWLDYNDATDPVTPGTTGLWMVWVWFGLDGTGIEKSVDFHNVLGPILMISFAILGNTLFLTILVSTLSESFSKIARHANGEVQFRRAVLTFQAVKSDAIFAYPPPFNLVALVTLLPLKLFLTPRWFHKVNIVLIRLLNAPLLFFVGLFERYYLWPSSGRNNGKSLARWLAKVGNFNWFQVHGDIEAVFDAPPPDFVDKSKDVLESRRRKSIKAVAPEEDQASLVERPTTTRSPKRQRTFASGGKQRSRSEGLKGTPQDNTDTRLERIEEMLEQIGHSLDDEGEDDSA